MWICIICTLENGNDEWLACDACGTPKAGPLPSAAPSTASSSAPPTAPPAPKAAAPTSAASSTAPPAAPPAAAAPAPPTAKPLAGIFLPKKRASTASDAPAAKKRAATAADAPAAKKRAATPAAPAARRGGPRRATEWCIKAARTYRLHFACSRDAAGALSATLVVGPTAPPAAGAARLYEGSRPTKLALGPDDASPAAECVVTLTLDAPAGAAAPPPWAPPYADYDGRRDCGAITLLQSHLQKCVRRGRAGLAARSARALACVAFGPANLVGLAALLRRLPIIAVEDSAPLPAAVLPVIWLMAATGAKPRDTDYRATAPDVAFVCAAAAALAKHPRRGGRDGRRSAGELPRDALSLALLVRKAYGGMAGDGAMLAAYAYGDGDDDDDAVRGLGPQPPLRPEDWIAEGVDFHCKNGEILARMRAATPALAAVDDGALKAWMWRTRSCVNVRDGAGFDRARDSPAWQDAAARAADDAARAMIRHAWRGGAS